MEDFHNQFLNQIILLKNIQISTIEFRDWLLDHYDMALNYLGEDLFEDFLLFDFYNKHTNLSLILLLNPKINWKEYERLRVEKILKAILAKEEIDNNLKLTYDLYCHGYTFLEELGINYGLEIIHHDDDTFYLENQILTEDFKTIKKLTEKVLGWLEREEIVLNQEDKNRWPKLSFQDFRTVKAYHVSDN